MSGSHALRGWLHPDVESLIRAPSNLVVDILSVRAGQETHSRISRCVCSDHHTLRHTLCNLKPKCVLCCRHMFKQLQKTIDSDLKLESLTVVSSPHLGTHIKRDPCFKIKHSLLDRESQLEDQDTKRYISKLAAWLDVQSKCMLWEFHQFDLWQYEMHRVAGNWVGC